MYDSRSQSQGNPILDSTGNKWINRIHAHLAGRGLQNAGRRTQMPRYPDTIRAPPRTGVADRERANLLTTPEPSTPAPVVVVVLLLLSDALACISIAWRQTRALAGEKGLFHTRPLSYC